MFVKGQEQHRTRHDLTVLGSTSALELVIGVLDMRYYPFVNSRNCGYGTVDLYVTYFQKLSDDQWSRNPPSLLWFIVE